MTTRTARPGTASADTASADTGPADTAPADTAPADTAPADTGRPRGRGLLIYASVLLAVLGCFNLLDGISALARSSVFIAGARYVIGDLRTWGIVIVAVGGLQLLAAAGVVAGRQFARWFGVAVLVVNAVAQMFFIQSYPVWSLMITAVDVVGIYALCAYGGRDSLG